MHLHRSKHTALAALVSAASAYFGRHHHSYHSLVSSRCPSFRDYYYPSEGTVVNVGPPLFPGQCMGPPTFPGQGVAPPTPPGQGVTPPTSPEQGGTPPSPDPEPEKPQVPESGCKGLEEGGKKRVISAETGKMLARCAKCGTGAAYDQSVGVHGDPSIPSHKSASWTAWTFEPFGDKCAIKSDINFYAARCNGCWRNGKHPDSLFNHVKTAGPPYSLWTVEKYGDSYAFKADTGKYIARCKDCVPGGTKSDFAFVNSDSPTGPALWTVSPA